MARRPFVALVCLAAEVGDALHVYLERRGYDVTRTAEEWEASSLLAAPGLDVAVIGELLASDEVLAMLRALSGDNQPSVILMRRSADLIEKVLALEMGASDFVESPFNVREVAARIGGLIARRGRGGPELVELENATVDLRSALVMHHSGVEDALSAGQVALFRLFLANPRKVLTRDDIMAEAPAETFDAFDRSIDSRIVRLRRKLDTESIVTIRGSGYRFDPPAH